MQAAVMSGRAATTRAATLLLALLLLSGRFSSGASILLLCSWTQVSPGGELHRSFLRSAPPRLYHAVWSRERALLGCAWSDDAAVVRDYASLCAEHTQNFSDDAEPRVLALLEEEEERCAPLNAQERTRWSAPGGGQRPQVRGHQRVKRGFIVPGTLWCGSGNKAPSYEDLGVFSATDSCCREHDQCEDTILSFHSQFGVFNSNIFTMSHCDCDNKFRGCLKEANDSIADVVGYTFFNLLKMQCFQFSHRLQCSQRNWFGLCKETKTALYAEVHPPTLYEMPDPEGGHANTTHFSINTTTAANVTESSSSDLQLATFTPSPPSPHGVPNPPGAPSPPGVPSSSGAPSPRGAPSPTWTNITHYGTSSEGPPGPPSEGRDDLENQTVTEQGPHIKAPQNSCGALKHLDECEDVILPRQRKFGLYNPDRRGLYHCNCTSRLFQTVARQRDLSPVRTVLMRHVAPSCFLPQDCSGCAAVLLETELPSLGRTRVSGPQKEEWRPLGAAKMKVRRQDRRRRKQEAVKLQRLCVRLLKRRGRVVV